MGNEADVDGLELDGQLGGGGGGGGLNDSLGRGFANEVSWSYDVSYTIP